MIIEFGQQWLNLGIYGRLARVKCGQVVFESGMWWLNSSKTNFRPWQKFQIKCAWFLTLSWRAKIWSIGLKYPKTTQSKGPTWSAEVGKLWDTLIIIYIHSLDTHYELTLSICSEINIISIQMDSFESIFYFFFNRCVSALNTIY